MAIKIQIRRGLASEWTSANPILALGEQGLETDTKKIKIGDGITAWNSLAYFNKSISELDAAYEPKNSNIQSHISSTANPHSVTKSQVGLGNVDNTSDANKPISSATQTELDLKANSSDVFTKTESNSNYEPKNSNIQSHISNTSNPHSVTKAQVGLSNVDNTSDASKPISGATQSALDLKANSANVYTKVESDSLDASTLSSANTYTDNKVAQVVNSAPATLDTLNELAAALGDDPNFATTTATLIGTKANSSDVYTKTQADINFEPKNINIQTHISSTSNPHSVTKSQIGLGDVDNISSADLRDRSTHTGTQLASTISDFTSAVQSVTIDAAKIDGGVVSNAEFATLDGITTGVTIQSQIDGKQDTITGAATSILSLDLTPSRVVTSDSSGKITNSSVNTTSLSYLDATSSIQTQLNGKQATGNYITALTGDITASGPGSVVATLSNTGVTAGSYDKITVDSKGRVTAASQIMWNYITNTPTTSNAITYGAVTGLTTDSLPIGMYSFKLMGKAQTAATTTGLGLRLVNNTATITTLSAKWLIPQAANGTASNFQIDQLATNTNVTSTAVLTANTDFVVWGEGIFRVTVAGSVQIQLRSEIASSNAILQADTVLQIINIG